MTSRNQEFEPIRQESTSALIARKLRDAIARGRFQPGEQLLESDIAKQFGVSRGLLREALQRLTQEGLLVGRRNRGLFVAEFGPDEVFDIYTARTAIERAACLKIIDVTKRTDEVYAVLTALTDRLEASAAAGVDESKLADIDIDFHERMVEEAHSPRLNRMYATLITETRMCLAALEGPSYPVAQRIAEHRQIAESIRDRDVPRLHTLLAEHMDHALDEIRHAFAARDA